MAGAVYVVGAVGKANKAREIYPKEIAVVDLQDDSFEFHTLVSAPSFLSYEALLQYCDAKEIAEWRRVGIPYHQFQVIMEMLRSAERIYACGPLVANFLIRNSFTNVRDLSLIFELEHEDKEQLCEYHVGQVEIQCCARALARGMKGKFMEMHKAPIATRNKFNMMFLNEIPSMPPSPSARDLMCAEEIVIESDEEETSSSESSQESASEAPDPQLAKKMIEEAFQFLEDTTDTKILPGSSVPSGTPTTFKGVLNSKGKKGIPQSMGEFEVESTVAMSAKGQVSPDE